MPSFDLNGSSIAMFDLFIQEPKALKYFDEWVVPREYISPHCI